MKVEVPSEKVRFSGYPGWPIFNSGDVLIPPSALPQGFRPAQATLTLLSSSAPETVREVLDGIGGVDPTTEVGTPGVVVTSLQQITVVKSLLGIGMILGLIIGVAAYLVAATDRAVERKPQVTALSLLGARPRTLRTVQVAQVVVPLAVGLALAVVLGKLAESSYLVTGGGAIYWDGAGVPLLLACAVGAVAVAAAGGAAPRRAPDRSGADPAGLSGGGDAKGAAPARGAAPFCVGGKPGGPRAMPPDTVGAPSRPNPRPPVPGE
jgi:hypothetical protein